MEPIRSGPDPLPDVLAAVEAGLPVLRATAVDLDRMERDQDRISGNALSAAILRDAFMSLRVMRFIHSHRSRSQTVDITTIAHAIMMLGQARFFREFTKLPVVDVQLKAHPQAVARIHAAMSRARLAALFARDWANCRHDMDPEEVMIAALLHDVTESLVVLWQPAADAQLPPAVAIDLRQRLFEQLGLPGLIRDLARDDSDLDARVLNVRYACDLARHCAYGWFDPAIAVDLANAQRLLHISAPELWERVRRVVLAAAREWTHYRVRPSAAYLLLLPDSDSDDRPGVGAEANPDAV